MSVSAADSPGDYSDRDSTPGSYLASSESTPFDPRARKKPITSSSSFSASPEKPLTTHSTQPTQSLSSLGHRSSHENTPQTRRNRATESTYAAISSITGDSPNFQHVQFSPNGGFFPPVYLGDQSPYMGGMTPTSAGTSAYYPTPPGFGTPGQSTSLNEPKLGISPAQHQPSFPSMVPVGYYGVVPSMGSSPYQNAVMIPGE